MYMLFKHVGEIGHLDKYLQTQIFKTRIYKVLRYLFVSNPL